MTDDELASAFDTVRANTALTTESLADYGKQFGRSAFYGTTSLIGMTTPPDVEAWRMKHPISGLASDLLGPVGYYGAAVKVGKEVLAGTKFLRSIDAIAASTKYPSIVGRALTDTASVLPFEGVRLGVTAATGGDVKEVGADIAIGAGLTTVLGAGIGALEAGGARTASRYGIDLGDQRWPTQLRLRDLVQGINDGKYVGDDLTKATNLMDQMKSDIRSERAKLETFKDDAGQRDPQSYIRGELEGGGDPQALNRAFRVTTNMGKEGGPTQGRPLRQRNYDQHPTLGFESRDALDETITRAGLPDNWEAYSQFPTYKSFLGDRLQQNFRKTVVEPNMTPIGDGWWMAREKDGLYTMGKQLPTRIHPQTGLPVPRQDWVFLKTDSPGFFNPKGGAQARAVDNYNAWFNKPDREVEANVTSEIFKATQDLAKDLPETAYIGGPGKSLMAKGGRGFAKMVGDVLKVGDTSAARDNIGRFTRKYLAPAMYEFAKNPTAARIHSIFKAAFDSADALAGNILHGAERLKPDQLSLLDLMRSPKSEGGLSKLIQALDDKDDLVNFSRVLYRGGGLEEAEKLGASDRVKDLLTGLNAVDVDRMHKLTSVQEASGLTRVRALPDHFMISRTWKGSYRAPIYEGDSVIALASGEARGDAQKEAEHIVAEGRKLGRDWNYRGEVMESDARGDLGFIARMTQSKSVLKLVGQIREDYHLKNPKAPQSFKYRSGMKGAIGEFRPFTKDDIYKQVSRHLQQNLRYEAELSVRHVEFNNLSRLKEQNAGVFNQVNQRVNDRLGIQGPIAAMQNRVLDEVLGPMLGQNSASKIVRGINEVIYKENLGFVNMAHNVANLLTFAQTVVPELYFIRGGVTERLAPHYSSFMRAGSDGLPREVLSRLDPIKTIGRAFGLIAKPQGDFAEAVIRARQEGVLSPRMIEEFVGPDAGLPTKLREAFAKPNGILRATWHLAGLIPEKTEALTRAHAFATGWLAGREILGQDADKAFEFAKQFAHRTMYGYGVADRARVFTGPFGSALGLFKNWQMHYIFQMMDYAGVGISHGQWKPFLTATAGTALIGGLPAAGPVYWLANTMAKDVFGKNIDEEWYSQWPRSDEGPNVSDAVFMGVPGFLPTLAGLPGFSITGQVAQPFSDPTRDISQMMSFVYYDRMKYLGRAVGAAFEAHDATGTNPLRDPAVVSNLSRALLPKSVYRVMQQTSEGAVRASGSLYPQVDGLTPSEQVLYSLGFNPHRLELAYKVNDRLWQDQNDKKELVSAIGQSMAAAQQARDFATMNKIQQRAMYMGVDMSRVMASTAAYSKKYREDMISRQGDKRMVNYYQRLGLI